MSMVDRIKASYQRLQDGVVAKPRVARAAQHCQLCSEPAWSEGLCPAHLVERGREITRARRFARREARRKQFFLAKREARQSGDLELWSEIGWRQRKGDELPTNVSPDAPWRAKWRKNK